MASFLGYGAFEPETKFRIRADFYSVTPATPELLPLLL
ncbi:MAG: hypothetical protein QOI53_1160, partial [Verrucomicrobiota bacterium]|nr:hypothetical protein [Verrucomicrobiota bacterium]